MLGLLGSYHSKTSTISTESKEKTKGQCRKGLCLLSMPFSLKCVQLEKIIQNLKTCFLTRARNSDVETVGFFALGLFNEPPPAILSSSDGLLGHGPVFLEVGKAGSQTCSEVTALCAF